MCPVEQIPPVKEKRRTIKSSASEVLVWKKKKGDKNTHKKDKNTHKKDKTKDRKTKRQKKQKTERQRD